MERSLFKPFLIVAGLMVITSLALAFTVDVRLEDVPGITMQLPDELGGEWIGNELRFCHNRKCIETSKAHGQYFLRDLEVPDVCPDCGEKLWPMSVEEYEALPKDTQFAKSVYTNAAGEQVFASIVLSGRERNSIHRPERCLKGQGNTIMKEYNLEVPFPGRKPLKVRVALLERPYRTPEGVKTYYGYYAYWFVGQDRETPSHYARMFWLGWDRITRSVAHRWAYIAVSGIREKKGKAYEKQIIRFVQMLYPAILRHDSPLYCPEMEKAALQAAEADAAEEPSSSEEKSTDAK